MESKTKEILESILSLLDGIIDQLEYTELAYTHDLYSDLRKIKEALRIIT